MEDTPKDEPTTQIETPPEKPEEAAAAAEPVEAKASKTPPPPTPPPVGPAVKKPRRAYTGVEIALIIVSIAAVLLLMSTIAMAVCGSGRFGRCDRDGFGRKGQRFEQGQRDWNNDGQMPNGYSPRMMPRFQQRGDQLPQSQSAPMPQQQQVPPIPGQSP